MLMLVSIGKMALEIAYRNSNFEVSSFMMIQIIRLEDF